MISVQLQVPTRLERYGDFIERIIAAATREDRRRRPPNPPKDPYYGERIEWRVELHSPTTTERRRNGMHHLDGRLVHTSELLGLHRTPREEPRAASSLDPYGSYTTEEIRLRGPLSRPLSSGSGGEAVEN